MKKKFPSVAIVGRTNVGKSTLFNRLSTSVKSLTLDYEGVTRDFVKDIVSWSDVTFELIDTGGADLAAIETPKSITDKVLKSVKKIIDEAQVILLVVDGSLGLTPGDRTIAEWCHKKKKRVILVVNKIDRKETYDHIHEWAGLGITDSVSLSAEHGTGIADLLELIVRYIPKESSIKEESKGFRVAIIGRPNAGKSSLMNALLQYERSIVSEHPGTTREPITENIQWYKESIALIDTAGVRRKRGISEKLEQMMVKSTFESVRNAHVVLLIIDSTEGKLVSQDLKLASFAFQNEYKAIIILFNKTDILDEEQQRLLNDSLEEYKFFIKKIPVMKISCKTMKNISHIVPLVNDVWQRLNQTFSSVELTSLFQQEMKRKPLITAEHQLRLYKAYQVKTNPITIVLEVNQPVWFETSKIAFFENIMRDNYNLVGVPLRFLTRK